MWVINEDLTGQELCSKNNSPHPSPPQHLGAVFLWAGVTCRLHLNNDWIIPVHRYLPLFCPHSLCRMLKVAWFVSSLIPSRLWAFWRQVLNVSPLSSQWGFSANFANNEQSESKIWPNQFFSTLHVLQNNWWIYEQADSFVKCFNLWCQSLTEKQTNLLPEEENL